jgi:hypothetical protein
MEDIERQGWKTAPIIVITVGARGAIHQTIKTQLKQSPLKLKTSATKKTMKTIHHNAIKFLMHAILTKRRIKNNQPLPPESP